VEMLKQFFGINFDTMSGVAFTKKQRRDVLDL